jgi:hypothetical protein
MTLQLLPKLPLIALMDFNGGFQMTREVLQSIRYDFFYVRNHFASSPIIKLTLNLPCNGYKQ